MLFKFTYPTRSDKADSYLAREAIEFEGTILETGYIAFKDDKGIIEYPTFDPVGLEIYMLDPHTGKTVDRVKWMVAKYV